jgi:hypothetical protein
MFVKNVLVTIIPNYKNRLGRKFLAPDDDDYEEDDDDDDDADDDNNNNDDDDDDNNNNNNNNNMEQVFSSGKASDMFSGDAGFESRPGLRLS